MSWIVLNEKNGLISLKSSGEDGDGLLPIGSFLTVKTTDDSKVILRVEESHQYDPYAPNPLISEMGLEGLIQDTKCHNIIKAKRIYHKSNRIDGKFDFIKSRDKADLSTNEDIKAALNASDKGPKIMPATVFAGENSLLKGNDGKYLNIKLSDKMFWHQMIICGSTGSGKTVAMKYLAQHFVEEMQGCVIALNVKDDDLLHMEKESEKNDQIMEEWASMGLDNYPKGIPDMNFQIYHPFGDSYDVPRYVDESRVYRITLSVDDIDPESLLGLVREQMTDIGSRWFPDIFRHWQAIPENNGAQFRDFVNWFDDDQRQRIFPTLDRNNNVSERELPGGSVANISRAIGQAQKFFDVSDSSHANASLFLERGKFSTIDLAGSEDGIEFGSIFLRHILADIKKVKSQFEDLPVLIIIDETHLFHSPEQGTKAALKYLDNIARTGRSNKIGIVFASQDLNTIPKGLSNIVNTTISFNCPDPNTARKFNIKPDELSAFDEGYAVGSFYKLRNLKYIKFPLSGAGIRKLS
jgi:uncharacterized protein